MLLTLSAALLATAVIFFVISPILQNQHAPLDAPDDGQRQDAEARKRVALMALRDAEYDFETGKLDEGDYRSLKSELSSEALAAIRDAEGGAETSGRPTDGRTGEAVRAGASAGESPPGDAGAHLEAEIARVRAGIRSGVTCGTCALVNRNGSRFCTRCGLPLDRPAREPSHV